MNGRKGILFSSLVCVIVLTGLYLLGANVFAIAWHLRHGFHARTNGFNFRVPLFYQVVQGSAANQFMIAEFPSPIRKKSSSITVLFPLWSSHQPVKPLSKDVAQRLGFVLRRNRTASLGSRPGYCIEYLSNALTVSGHPSRFDMIWITCSFGKDLEVTFDGSRNTVGDFYSFMQAVKEVKQ